MEEILAVKEFVEGNTFFEIVKKSENKFRVTEDGNLYMLSFLDLDNPLSRFMNGVIFEKETNKLVHYSFQKTFDEQDKYHGVIPEDYDIEISTEGTHIKLFYHEEEWKVATSRCINAAISFWGSDKSFKEMFLESFDYVIEEEFCYSFIMQHPDLGNPLPYSHMINYVDLKNNKVVRTTDNFKINLTIKQAIENCKNKDFYGQYTVFFKDGKRVKLLSETYKKVKNLLHNNKPLQQALIHNKSYEDFLVLEKVFKEKVKHFVDVMTYTVDHIHESYMNKYVFKKDNSVYFKHYKVVRGLHSTHLREKVKITKQHVYENLMGLSDRNLENILDI